jgi:SulP family sulfate permease
LYAAPGALILYRLAPGIVVVRPETALFFANADAVRDAIRGHVAADTRAVVLDAETVPAIDVTAVSMLTALAGDLRRDRLELVLARDVGTIRDLVQLGGHDGAIETYPTVRAAIDALQSEGR